MRTKKNAAMNAAFSLQAGSIELLRDRLLEHAIDLLVRRIDRRLGSLSSRQRLVRRALRTAGSLRRLAGRALRGAGRTRSRIRRRLRCIRLSLQLGNLRLQVS